MNQVALAITLTLCLVAPNLALSHALSPAAVLIREGEAGLITVELRQPLGGRADLTISLPDGCEPDQPKRSIADESRIERSTLKAGCTLFGRTLTVAGLSESDTTALLHAQWKTGESVRAVLTPEEPTLVFPERSHPLDVARTYLRLGAEHLLVGLDHILFLCGLVLLAQTARKLVLAVTMFTLGHSVTLCLQAVSATGIAPALAEVAIALSIVLLASEIASGRRRDQLVVGFAAVSGLVHGLGFSNVLREVGLPEQAIPLSLGAFNVGIELGQLLVIGLLSCLGLLLRRLPDWARERGRFASAYAMGSLSAMWCIERALG